MTWSEFFKETFIFSGRLGRNRFNNCVSKVGMPFIILWLAHNIINDIPELNERLSRLNSMVEGTMWLIFVFFVVCMCFLLPRRLHDFDCSGWWTLLPLIIGLIGAPFIGILTIIFWILIGDQEGTDGKNKYGEPPPDD